MNQGMMVEGPENDEYETPSWLWQALNTEFGFTLDPAATTANALLPNHYTVKEDGLKMPWPGRVYVNPPYSQAGLWVSKALAALKAESELIVTLLPVRTDNDWFAALRWAETKQYAELRFFRKRIRFCLKGLPAESPRFPSFVAVLR